MISWIITGLGICIIMYGCQSTYPGIVDNTVGVYGPVRLKLSKLIHTEYFEDDLHFCIQRYRDIEQSAITGSIEWENDNLLFTPDLALISGCDYAVQMNKKGDEGKGDQSYHLINHQFKVRQPSILYLSPADDDAQLWRSSISSDSTVKLTNRDHGVYDYAATRDGKWVIYSAINLDGGIDLWKVDRDGLEEVQLLSCGLEWCIQPAISVSSDKIAYVRMVDPAMSQRGINDDLTAGGSRIWIFNINTGESNLLSSEQDESVYRNELMPIWSPDGNWLAYYVNRGYERGIQIVDANEKNFDVFFLTNIESSGTWSGDGRRLLFIDMRLIPDLYPKYRLLEANLATGEVKHLLDNELTALDFNLPSYTPSGQRVILSEQPVERVHNKQLTLRDLDGDQYVAITSDNQYNFAAYQWEPGGYGLVFQRFSSTSSDAVPQVVLWTSSEIDPSRNCEYPMSDELTTLMQNDVFRIIAVNAALPAWIP